MTYLLLLAAILAEVAGTSLLKNTEGFTKLWPSLICLAAYGVAFFLLAQAIGRGMQVGPAYAMWSALGTALIVTIGIVFLGEPLSLTKVVGVVLVIGGVITLNLAGAH